MGKKPRPRAPATTSISVADDPAYNSPAARSAFLALKEQLAQSIYADDPALDDAYVWRQVVGTDFVAKDAYESATKGLSLARKYDLSNLKYEDVKPCVDTGVVIVHNKDSRGRPTILARVASSLMIRPHSPRRRYAAPR